MTEAYKINSSRDVAVSTETEWRTDMANCPRGVKVQLLGAGHVGTHGVYNGSPFWVGWYPMLKIPKELL